MLHLSFNYFFFPRFAAGFLPEAAAFPFGFATTTEDCSSSSDSEPLTISSTSWISGSNFSPGPAPAVRAALPLEIEDLKSALYYLVSCVFVAVGIALNSSSQTADQS
jgi:hypothetical protein